MKLILPKILVMTTLASLLAGCVQPDGSPDNTGTGALIGGASGAAIGALADRRAPGAGAAIGALAGLVAGGLIGHSVDQQQAAEQRAYTPPPPRPLEIEDVKALARSGVNDDVIIDQINSTRSVYHLSADTIIDLTHAGVSQRVINYMINTPNTSVVNQTPPPPEDEVVVASPGPGYVWAGGDWQWNGVTWVWVGGHWIWPPRPYAVWVGPHWVHGRYGWYHENGYWR